MDLFLIANLPNYLCRYTPGNAVCRDIIRYDGVSCDEWRIVTANGDSSIEIHASPRDASWLTNGVAVTVFDFRPDFIFEFQPDLASSLLAHLTQGVVALLEPAAFCENLPKRLDLVK